MLLHYQIRICISGHSKFEMDWILLFFLQNCFYIRLLIIMFIRMCDNNIERPTTFVILEKQRKN